MRFSVAIAALAATVVSASHANSTDSCITSTEVVKEYTTYCPGSTIITHGTNFYTVTEATTLTISDCPSYGCTITKTYTSAPTSEVAPTSAVDTYTPPAVSSYPTATGTGSGPSYGNGTSTYPTGSGPASPSSTDVFEGAANRATVAGGALFGLLGVVAYLL